VTTDPIRELVHRYSDAVVHQDREQWRSCWAAESHWELAPDRSVSGREAIVAHWEESVDSIEVVVQTVSNGAATTADERGEGRWYITEHVLRTNGTVNIMLAYYDDTYVCLDGHWCFASRRLTRLYHGPPDLSGPFSSPPPRPAT